MIGHAEVFKQDTCGSVRVAMQRRGPLLDEFEKSGVM
jgi:hypothetical protein